MGLFGSNKKTSIKDEIEVLVATFNTREKEAENLEAGGSDQDAIEQCLNAGKQELQLLNALFAMAGKSNFFSFTLFLPKEGRAKADEVKERFRVTKRTLERFVTKTRGALRSLGKLIDAAGPSEDGKKYACAGYAIVDLLKDARARYEPELKGDRLLANAEEEWKLLLRSSMQKWPEPERIGDASMLRDETAREKAAVGSWSDIRRP